MYKISKIILFSLFVFFSCTGRPTETDAIKYFKTLNPKAVIISIRIDEDEVACRTFEIIYKDINKKLIKSYLLYFDDSRNPHWIYRQNNERMD